MLVDLNAIEIAHIAIVLTLHSIKENDEQAANIALNLLDKFEKAIDDEEALHNL